MKIRWKLLILLLAIALAPLITGAVLSRVSTRRIGGRLASDRRKILTETARHHLQHIVDDYGKIIERDSEILELALSIQAREVEDRLAKDPPPPRRLLFSEDFDEGDNPPKGMVLSDKHYRAGTDGKVVPMPVTYHQQVYFLAAGVDRQTVADEMARLSTMPEVYRFLLRSNPDRMQWQYTSLESGFHTCFPGNGPYPPDYDPRKRLWYQSAKKNDSLVWLPPIVDVSTRMVVLTLAMPVRRPDGALAGVTAIDVPLAGIFKQLQLPQQWSEVASTMLVIPGWQGDETEDKLVILAQQNYQDIRQHWQTPVKLQFLKSDDAQGLEALRIDALAGRSGVRKMRYRGRQALWTYGAGGAKKAFPVVIVPYEKVIAHATAAERYVLDRMAQGLKITGIILLGVVVVVVVVASVISRRVTRPLVQIAEAAEKLADGDYDAQVRVRTGDELQDLGEAFNDMGLKLREREQMKQSLALAMEIQQHLLPQESPKIDGFDVFGASVYCDETGGDYYDFIDLVDLGEGKLGIAVGDITGHGIGAALLMASARGVLRSHAGRHGGNLSELFGVLNTHLVRDTGERRFMTLFYGILDARNRSLEWTSGGHDPALWLRRSTGKFDELPNTGVPLGIMDAATFEQLEPVTLETGDIVAIGTDGIWEAANADSELFGKDRMRKILSVCAEKSARDIHTAVIAAVNEFLGQTHQQDDITLVIIKATT